MVFVISLWTLEDSCHFLVDRGRLLLFRGGLWMVVVWRHEYVLLRQLCETIGHKPLLTHIHGGTWDSNYATNPLEGLAVQRAEHSVHHHSNSESGSHISSKCSKSAEESQKGKPL